MRPIARCVTRSVVCVPVCQAHGNKLGVSAAVYAAKGIISNLNNGMMTRLLQPTVMHPTLRYHTTLFPVKNMPAYRQNSLTYFDKLL